MIPVRKMSLCTYSIPVLTALLHVYNHTLTFTKLATDSASDVKSKSGNFLAYMNLYTVLGHDPAFG